MAIQKPEHINHAVRAFRLEVGWLGDHPSFPSAHSVDEDCSTLVECLELRLAYHPASTYIVAVQQHPDWVLHRVAAALNSSPRLHLSANDSTNWLSIRLRQPSDARGEARLADLPKQDGLALLLAESVECVLANFANAVSKRKPPAPDRREIQGVLFD